MVPALFEHCPRASAAYLFAMVLAVLGEAACCRVEVAAIERLIELTRESHTNPHFACSHANPIAATIWCKKGTASQSTDEDKLGKRRPYRRLFE